MLPLRVAQRASVLTIIVVWLTLPQVHISAAEPASADQGARVLQHGDGVMLPVAVLSRGVSVPQLTWHHGGGFVSMPSVICQARLMGEAIAPPPSTQSHEFKCNSSCPLVALHCLLTI